MSDQSVDVFLRFVPAAVIEEVQDSAGVTAEDDGTTLVALLRRLAEDGETSGYRVIQGLN